MKPAPIKISVPFELAEHLAGCANRDGVSLEHFIMLRLSSMSEVSKAKIEKAIHVACDYFEPGPCRYPVCDCRRLPGLIKGALEGSKDVP